MANEITITGIDIDTYQYETHDLGPDDAYNGFNTVYTPGAVWKRTGHILLIHTSAGITGEFVGGSDSDYAQMKIFLKYLIGKNPMQRELIYNDVKRALRKMDRMSMGPVDIALWDIAGKLYNAPVYEMLGGYRKALPAYASTYHGDDNGGLDSPEAFADFAEQCYAMGYRAFKIHGWSHAPIRREVENVLTVGKRVGHKMDLMLDPACEYETFADALRVGRACDEAKFFWYEDPFKDGGLSCFAQRKLRQMIKTPILMGEHVRTLEPKVDAVVAEATDYMRVNPTYDLGITGAIKVAHAAEGFGMDVEIHGAGPSQRHVMASVRNANYYELALVHPKAASTSPPVYTDYSDRLDSIDANGCVPVPEGPGLGVTIDWDFIAAHRVGTEKYT
ncbi:MAG: mandelate racemase [Anaerolineales bacterium]|nr:MAG: mandelate racemase [Anaerolineales bacterium]